MIPKKNIPMYAEFYEGRHFTPGEETVTEYRLGKQVIPFGSNLLFRCEELPELVLGCELCEDLWVAEPPSSSHALMGATVIANLSASNETVSKDDYRTLLIKASSARLLCGYIYTSAGEGESTQDLVFGGHDLSAENGTLLVQSARFTTGILYTDLDVLKISSERRRMGTFGKRPMKPYLTVPFSMQLTGTKLDRKFAAHPFVPEDMVERNRRCEDILSIQAFGLKKRYEHIGCKTAVLGISGGLDSMWPAKPAAEFITARLKDKNFAYEYRHISYEHGSHYMVPMHLKTEKMFKAERKYKAESREIKWDQMKKTLEFLKRW